MLAQLRQNTKIILWVVIVAFVGLIFVVWGMNLRSSGGPEAGFMGKVAGDRITLAEYRNEAANQRAAYYESEGERPGAQAERAIADRAWESIVQHHLLWREATEQKLLATDEEVLFELQSNPPPFIRAQPVFQTDSVYDHSKYLAALSDPSIDFGFLENYVRATLPLQKLQDYIVSGVRVTEQETRMLARMLEEQVTISYIAVSPLSSVREEIPEPTRTQLEAFYNSNMEDFRIPEKRSVAYVEFPKKPSAEDERYAREKIEEAYDLIVAEEPFDEIAVEYSDDPGSSSDGGDLGWIRQGFLAGVLDSAAFSLEAGQMSEILRTAEGFHILRVEDTRESNGIEEVHLSYILSKLEASPLTIERIANDASEFTQAARGKGIAEAAGEEAYQSSTSQDLAVHEMRAVFGLSQGDAQSIFALGPDRTIGPIEGSRGFYVFQVTKIVPSHIPPLDDIAGSARQSYITERRRQKAGEIADAVVAELASGRSLEDAAKSRDLEVVTTQPFSRLSTVPGIGKNNPVLARAFVLGESETSDAIDHSGQYYVIRLDQRQEVDAERLAQNLPNLRLSLHGTKQQVFMGEWYDKLKQGVAIEDYRTFGAGY
jgi:peptidyl-prolyl cis-trans isomerase D